jgi:hypothetical protein
MRGASTPVPQVFTAWCLVKHRIRLHGVVLVKHKLRLHGWYLVKYRIGLHGVVLS